jgi:integrase
MPRDMIPLHPAELIESAEILPPARKASKRSRPRVPLIVPGLRNYPLGDEFAAAAPAPDPSGQQRLYFDQSLVGFALLCSGRTASKSWACKLGQMRRVIGRADLLPFERARDIARHWLGLMERGIDPAEVEAAQKAQREAAKRRQEVEGVTFRHAMEAYLSDRKGGSLRPKTKGLYRYLLTHYCRDWLDRPVRALTAADLSARHRSIREQIAARRQGEARGDGTANTTLRVVNAILQHFRGTQQDALGFDPTLAMKGRWSPERHRKGHVADDELAAFWQASQTIPDRLQRVALQILLFSGARRREILALKWSEFDMKRRRIVLGPHRNKSKREFVMPLSSVPYALLADLRSVGRDLSDYVFPSRAVEGHIQGLESALGIVGKAIGHDLVLHDLRRTFRSVAEMAGLTEFEKRKLVNHTTTGDVDLAYVQRSEEALAAAAERVGRVIADLCQIEPKPRSPAAE